MKPTRDNVLVKPDESEISKRARESGLALPDSQNKRVSSVGVIVAIGPDCTSVKAGTRVMYEQYAGTEIQHDGDDLLVVPEGSVLAEVEDGD